MKKLSLILLGMILGAALVFFMQAQQITDLYRSNTELALANQELLIQVNALQKKIDQHKLRIVRVRCNYIGIEQELVAELDKLVQPILRPVVGQDILTTNPEALKNMVDGRTFTVGQRQVKLKVQVLLVAPTTEMEIVCSFGASTEEDDEP